MQVAVLPGLLAALLSAGCGDAGTDQRTIVATTTILGDVVDAVAGDDALVEVLLPVGADPHDYRPSARDVAALEGADLVVANGLGLEDGLADALEEAPRVVFVGPELDPLPFGDGDDDPHVWLDPLRMAEAARVVAAALAESDPGPDWAGRAASYAAEMEAVHAEVESILAAVPPERRKLVTNHDSLGYLAARYGFEVVGSVIPGGATLAEPSSAQLAELVALIEREGVPAIFAETTEPTTLAEALAAEVPGVTVVELFSGSLGEPGSGTDTLAGMLLANARLIAEALA